MLKCIILICVGEKLLLQNRKLENLKRFYLEANVSKKKKRIRPNQLIKNAAENMNNVIPLKYGLAPEKIEERNLDPNNGKYFKQDYDFVRLRKIQNNQLRNDKYNKKIDRRKRT